jgi:photosystem II stability/assembly factor-like uncharacterized protein
MKKVKWFGILFLTVLLCACRLEAQWQSQVSLYGGVFTDFFSAHDTLYLTTDRGIFRTANEGKSWSGNLSKASYNDKTVLSVAESGNFIYCLGNNSIYRYSRSFKDCQQTLSSLYCQKLFGVGDTLFSVSKDDYDSGVYLISSNGEKFKKVFGPRSSYNFRTRTMAIANKVLYVSTMDSGMFRSTDMGSTWQQINKGLQGKPFSPYMLKSDGDTVYAVGFAGEKLWIFYIANQQEEWSQFSSAVPGLDNLMSMTKVDGGLYVSVTDYYPGTEVVCCAIYKTTDCGKNWLKIKENPKTIGSFLLYSHNGFLYQGASTTRGAMFASGVFKTKDDGVNWIDLGLRIDFNCIAVVTPYIWTIGDVYFGSSKNGIFLNYDFLNSGLPENVSVLSIHKVKGEQASGSLYAGTDKGLYYFDQQWFSASPALQNDSITCLTTIFKGIEYTTLAGTNRGIFASSGWLGEFKSANSGLGNLRIKALFSSDTSAFACTENGIYYSQDRGKNWVPVNAGLGGSSVFVKSICKLKDTLFIGTKSGLYKSGMGPVFWKISNFSGKEINCVYSAGNHVFAAVTNEGVYCSTDFGLSWKAINEGFDGLNVKAFTSFMNTLYAAVENYGIYKLEFKELGLPVELVSFSAVNNKNKVNINWTTATEQNNRGFEIERMTDNMHDFITVGFVPGSGNSVGEREYSFVDNISFFKTTSAKYRLKQIDFDGRYTYSKVIETQNILPDKLMLFQNFPNPFNPGTNVKFAVPADGKTTLTLYNVMGQKVKTLVNEFRNAGFYELKVDLGELSSGVYFYTLNSGGLSVTKKMIIQK